MSYLSNPLPSSQHHKTPFQFIQDIYNSFSGSHYSMCCFSFVKNINNRYHLSTFSKSPRTLFQPFIVACFLLQQCFQIKNLTIKFLYLQVVIVFFELWHCYFDITLCIIFYCSWLSPTTLYTDLFFDIFDAKISINDSWWCIFAKLLDGGHFINFDCAGVGSLSFLFWLD